MQAHCTQFCGAGKWVRGGLLQLDSLEPLWGGLNLAQPANYEG
jgi:hypothetical protein